METSASRVRCNAELNAPLFNFMSVLSSHKLLYSLPATLPSTCAGERRRRKIAFPDPGKESMACSFSKWIRVPHCRSCRARSRLKEGLASPVVWDGCCQRGGVCTLWSRARPVSALRPIPNSPKDPNPCRDLFHIMGKLGRQALSSCNITVEEAVLDSNQFNLHIQRQFITRFLHTEAQAPAVTQKLMASSQQVTQLLRRRRVQKAFGESFR